MFVLPDIFRKEAYLLYQLVLKAVHFPTGSVKKTWMVVVITCGSTLAILVLIGCFYFLRSQRMEKNTGRFSYNVVNFVENKN